MEEIWWTSEDFGMVFPPSNRLKKTPLAKMEGFDSLERVICCDVTMSEGEDNLLLNSQNRGNVLYLYPMDQTPCRYPVFHDSRWEYCKVLDLSNISHVDSDLN